MAIDQRRNMGYAPDGTLDSLPPDVIVAQRDPGSSDFAEIGTFWVNPSNDTVWCLTSIVSGSSTWTTSPASGLGSFTSVDIDPGDLHLLGAMGSILVDSGDLTLTSGNAVIGGDLSVAGTTTISGDFDLTSAALIDLTSTLDAAPSILLHADGGTSEQILLHSDQGTAVDSISLLSDVGGVALASGLVSVDAISLTASVGGIDIDSALLLDITSSRNNAQAILIEATAGGIDISASAASAGEDIDIVATGSSVNINSTENVADSIVISSTNGGIDISALAAAAGEDIDITATGSSVNLTSTEDAALAIYLHANGGTSETIRVHSDQGTGVGSVNLLSDVGGITVTATGLATADAINFEAVAGGIDWNSALQSNIDSSQVAVDAIRVLASDVAGGIDIDCGTGGITIDSTGAFSIDGAAASNVTTTGAGIDLTLSSVLGSVLVSSTEDAALAIYLHANGGTSETIRLHADQGTGVGSVNLLSDVGGITLTATGLASADAINFEASAGGIDWNSALQSNIDSSQAAVNALRLIASNAAGGIDVDAGTAGITLDSTGAISIDAAAASNFTATGAFDVTLSSTAGSMIVSGGEAVADAVQLTAGNAAGGVTVATGTGGVTVNSTNGIIALNSGTAAINIGTDAVAHTISLGNSSGATSLVLDSGTGAINIGTNAIAHTTTIGNGTGASAVSVNVGTGALNLGTNAVAHTVTVGGTTGAAATVIQAGTGKIALSSAGLVTMVALTVTSSAAGTSVTLNTNVGAATFTGSTTASAGTVTLTVNNSVAAATSQVLYGISNQGSNDAQMTLQRLKLGAGTMDFTFKNNGAAALNGDVIISFWIIG